MTLATDLQTQRAAVSEFRDAIETFDTNPNFRPVGNQPLAILEARLAHAEDIKEQHRLLMIARESLATAEKSLQGMEDAFADLQTLHDDLVARCNESAGHITEMAQALQRAVEYHVKIHNDLVETSHQLNCSNPSQISLGCPQNYKYPCIKRESHALYLTA
jgi:chromosome segregation ATPase